ncbi:hypothetical protein MRBLWO14_001175 [Microbacterium sp. LWO14-1.2]|uniref:hypothetical protein n=1 Tax=Microbacterium sp. LWO14-1.2 TaxID=3135263 RepID=UPI003138CB2E
MAGEYTTEDLVGDHHLQTGNTGGLIDGNTLAGRAEARPAFWGFCAHCGWKVGGHDTTRAVKRAYERHLKAAARKEAR